jgi:AcrR family transcriptional regulator
MSSTRKIATNGGARRTGNGRSRGLSRAAIVAAAVAYVDEHGLADLTMREVAGALGVEAMSLYHYVTGRESLLDGMVESVVDELYADPEVYLEPRNGWEDYLTRLAFGVRRIAMDHPRLFPLVSTRPPAAPWVRPPLRSLRWMNSFLEGLVSDGFNDDDAAAVYRAFTSFLLGHLLLDVAALNVDLSPVADDRVGSPAGAAPAEAVPALAEYPYLERMQDNLSQDFALPEFTSSLHNLLGRLADLRTAAS